MQDYYLNHLPKESKPLKQFYNTCYSMKNNHNLKPMQTSDGFKFDSLNNDLKDLSADGELSPEQGLMQLLDKNRKIAKITTARPSQNYQAKSDMLSTM